MTLRRATIVTMCALTAAVLLAAVLVGQFLMLPSFARLEKEQSYTNGERVISILSREIDALEGTTTDWAYWDDTYEFIGDLNVDYLDSNLTFTTFVSLNVDTILLIDTGGKIAISRTYDFTKNEFTELPAGLADLLEKDTMLTSPTSQDNPVSGIIRLPKGPMIISSCAILKSDRTGPSRGFLMMAR